MVEGTEGVSQVPHCRDCLCVKTEVQGLMARAAGSSTVTPLTVVKMPRPRAEKGLSQHHTAVVEIDEPPNLTLAPSGLQFLLVGTAVAWSV